MKRSPLTRRLDEDYAVTYLLGPPHPFKKPIGREDKEHIAIDANAGNFWWFNEGIGEWSDIDSGGPMASSVKAEIMGLKKAGMQYGLTVSQRILFRRFLNNVRIDLEERLTSP